MKNKEEIEDKINQLNNDLFIVNNKIEKCINFIIDRLLEKEIEHKLFGKGKILTQEGSIIQIQFKDNVIKKFKIPDVFVKNFIIMNEMQREQIEKLINLNQQKDDIIKKITENENILNKIANENKIESKDIFCKEAKQCVEQGYICVDDNVEFKTIRDVSDLFNKHYNGFQRSWIKVDSDWQRVASCYQMSSASDRNIYKNILTADGNYFYYLINEDSDVKKEEAVNGIIEHEMKITFLFLKYPNATGYKFVGVFEKDIDAMKKSIENMEYKVVYKKVDDKLDLTQFFK